MAHQAMKTTDLKVLQLMDPETQEIFQVFLNPEDYNRAHEDVQFATSLLFHTKCTSKSTTIVVDESSNENVSSPSSNENVSSPSSNKNVSSSSSMPLSSVNENLSSPNAYVCAPNNENLCSPGDHTIWGYNEVLQLIDSFNTHKDDLTHPKKRKNVYENVANDLISAGCNVNAVKVQNKWKSLVRSYSKAKDTKNRTGTGPSRFQFFDVMDDILGQKPSNACRHALNSSVNSSITGEAEPEASCSSTQNQMEISSKDENIAPMKRLSEKRLKRDYILNKKEEYAKRQKRHEERVALERERLQLEKRKLDILEKLLHR